jgi:diguanylate cyclase (GGDEF)-like protein/PAS domain S-box-containing protein
MATAMHVRIAIIDDRATNLRIYTQFVSLMGPEYEAICFQSALAALDWLQNEQPDLLIVDFRMPEMDGAEFIRKVRSSAKNMATPAIMITARQDRECRFSALDAGATDFLQSPVSHVEFSDRAKRLIQPKVESQTSRDGVNGTVTENSAVVGTENPRSMLEQIIDTTPTLINATDRDGKFLFLNVYQAALFGKQQDELIGKSIFDVMEKGLAEREFRRNQIVIENGEIPPNYEEQYTSQGVDLTLHCNKSPLTNKAGQIVGVLTTGIDITARKYAEEHRAHLALHDMLTGLPNRVLLAEQMSNTIADCHSNGSISALLLLDLDRFKVINDTRGHQAGDGLLRQVSDRISSTIGTKDFAARIGGDEFAIIVKDASNIEDIISLCTKLQKIIGRPFEISGVDQQIGVSIGVALIPEDGNSPDELLRLADLAMYQAKANGRNCHCFFSAQLNEIAQSNANMEADLRDALDKGQFFLEYQPIIDVYSRKYVGLEALVRWQHPVRGRMMPDEFIRVANDSGLIDGIGLWVIDAACAQIAEFMTRGVDIPHIAVNVSPRQFESGAMCDAIVERLDKHGVPHGKLAIEITEELLLDHTKKVHEDLLKLRSFGIQISIDDFGTGYSSLQYLRDLPATRLKIDRTFISRIEHSETDRAIITTIAHLAHALKMQVVAEGVETENQFDILRASGCDEIQGYYIGRPLAIDQLWQLFGHGPAYFTKANAK